ncbi:MAG TPA: AMP-binding protein, partial [Ramlibacter sp.]|nr:AMP-binding protein [Ramlibacter sp.]
MPHEVELKTSLWEADHSEPLLEITLGDLLRQMAREAPDRVGFIEAPPPPLPTRRWTYGELLKSAEASARALLRRFRPGDRVAVWSPNCAEWVLLQHGAAMAGMVLVTVNPAYLAEELRHVLSASGAAGIFHAPEYRGVDMSATVARLRAELPDLRESFSLAEWDAFVATSDPALALPAVAPDDVIQIQFTSGTTGKPKGARLHHRGVINAARFAAQRAAFPEGGVWATAMPLFHVGGCAGSELGAMTSRGTFVLQPAFDAGDMLRVIEQERVNHLHAVPTMVIRILEHPQRSAHDLRSLRTLMSGGSPVPQSLVRRAREEMGCRFTITFGQTELNGVVCQTYPDDTVERTTSTIGQPSPRMEVKIADPATGAALPLGQPGEIWARGYQVMSGYYNLPADADKGITDDGWLRTGDLAAMDAAGYLRITGRLKDCIIRGGENVYPREVEDVLLQHPAVLEVSVVGVPDPQWGEQVAAAIRLRPDASAPPAAQLYEHCRRLLASYKTPVLWFYVDVFPTTTSGKIQKFALRD